jgi:hypothetical protein
MGHFSFLQSPKIVTAKARQALLPLRLFIYCVVIPMKHDCYRTLYPTRFAVTCSASLFSTPAQSLVRVCANNISIGLLSVCDCNATATVFFYGCRERGNLLQLVHQRVFLNQFAEGVHEWLLPEST